MTDDTNDIPTRDARDESSASNDSTLTEAELKTRQQELQDYRRALEQELTIQSDKDPDNNYTNALEFFRKQIPIAAAQIAHLAQFSTSDSTRLAANKYMIEAVRRGFVESPEDPVADILKKIMKIPDSIPEEQTR